MAAQGEDTPPDVSGPDEETTKMLADMEKNIREDINKRASLAGEQLQYQMQQHFDSRMKNMTDRYNTHAEGQIQGRQTDVLRVNKAFREVARQLGADWKPVYRILMVAVDGSVLDDNITKIERQRPFMQAFKALTMWRDDQGGAFSMSPLVDALRACEKYELADMTLDILESSGDKLYMLENVGKGVASAAMGTDAHGDGMDFQADNIGAAAPSGDQQTDSGTSERVAAAKAIAAAKRASMMTYSQGKVEDRELLNLSKKLVKDWMQVGKHLGVSDEDLTEIKEHEGSESYQAAFKMLFTWRDAMDEINQDHMATLTQGLTLAGRRDLVDQLQKT